MSWALTNDYVDIIEKAFSSRDADSFMLQLSYQLFKIFGYEQLHDQSKYYIKIKNYKKAIGTVQ